METAKLMNHVTRSTKRGGSNSVPEDPFRVEAETSMDSMAEPAAADGRNPAITSGMAIVTEAEASARGGV